MKDIKKRQCGIEIEKRTKEIGNQKQIKETDKSLLEA